MLALVWCPPGWCCGKLYLVSDLSVWRCPQSGARAHMVLTDLDWLVSSERMLRRGLLGDQQRKLDLLAEAGQCAGLLGPWPFAKQSQEQKKHLRHLIRDLFGNPSRPLPPVPASVLAWNDGIVKRLAEAVYADRIVPTAALEPQRLAVLADALEEAGADAELVAHLRAPGQHYHGCHAVDHVLGRK